MKRFFFSLLAMLLILTANGNAQDLSGSFSLAPFGGLGIPVGDLADTDSAAVLYGDGAFRATGVKFGLAGEYFATPQLGFGLNVRYATFGSKDLELMGQTISSDSKLNAILVGVHGKYFFVPEGTVRPYGIVGAGLSLAKFKEVEGLFYGLPGDLEIDVDTRFGLIFGGGVSYFVSPKISVFGEATFDYWMSDGAILESDGEELWEISTNYYFVDLVVGLNLWFGGATQ